MKLQRDLTPRYFSITPIVVRGDKAATEERFDGNVLTLAIDDTYEGVPLKMMELFVTIAALQDGCGILKIDDDTRVAPNAMMEPSQIPLLFGMADYMGVAVQGPMHDRMWHAGKCTQPAPDAYGKPMRAAWARGALYALSGTALQRLAQYYMRFPGLLEGETYEDKAVGDFLHACDIPITPSPLEAALGLNTSEQDR